MDERWDHLVTGATLATLSGTSYGLIEDGAVAWRDGRIVFAGPARELPRAPGDCARRVEHVDGALVTPGLVDCHTHTVFAGDRADEFERRLEGATYEEIARAGGGIASTVRKTRAASEDELLRQSLPRARALRDGGVTTLEIKSGYGLELDAERRMLRVARAIARELGITVRTSFLGLHALPPGWDRARAAIEYVEPVVLEWLPALADEGLVDAVDAYCESIAFSRTECTLLFEAAQARGIPAKLHADQLSNMHAAALAAHFSALSADHLEHTDDAGIAAMAAAGTVAVLLPGSFYALRETKLPPIEGLRAHQVPIAIASDLNPGTSPLCSLVLAMSMACTLFRMTPVEAFRGTTVNAARALGLAERKGVLAPGADADIVVWTCAHPAQLAYWIGANPVRRVYAGGRLVAG